jgi:hypothetical protein
MKMTSIYRSCASVLLAFLMAFPPSITAQADDGDMDTQEGIRKTRKAVEASAEETRQARFGNLLGYYRDSGMTLAPEAMEFLKEIRSLELESGVALLKKMLNPLAPERSFHAARILAD